MKGQFSRKRLVLSVAAAGMALSCAIAAAQAQAAQYHVRYAMQKVPEDYVYRAKDWGKPYDVKVTEMVSPSGVRSMQHLLSGQADCADSGSGPILSTISRAPQDLTIVSATHSGGQRHELMVKPNAKYSSLAQLKGKRIAIRVGSGAYIAFEKYIASKHWSNRDFNIVNMAPSDMGAAISSGQVAGAITWEPTPSILYTKHIVKIIQNFGSVTTDPALMVCTTKFVKHHPKAVEHFLASIMAMYKVIRTDPQAAGKEAAKVASRSGVSVPPAAFTRAFKHMTFDMHLSPENLKDLESNAKFMVAHHRISKVPNIPARIDTKYLAAAAKLAG